MGAPAIFFAPHCDDETLQMGVEIGRHVTAGRPVTVVCAATGEQTYASAYLDGTTYCGVHGYTHDPVAEGRTAMTPAALSAARRAEMASACAAMRVAELVEGTVPDDALTVAVWRDLLLEHEHRATEGASVFVPTPWETTSGVGNPNHGNAGLALAQLRAEGHYAGAWVAYTVFSRYWTTPGCPSGLTRGPGTDEERRRLLAAADAYRAWSPKAGALGIGWCHSVPDDFAAGFATPSSPRYLAGRYYV